MQLADFASHRIEGFTREGNHVIDVPLFSHIAGNLYVGGCPEGEAPEEFDFIVSMFPWRQYKTHEHQIVTKAYLFDQDSIPNPAKLFVLAAHVNECLKHGKTLVHCQAGLNRSNLVAGLALIEVGMKPQSAIDLLRKQRCDAVLCNKAFEAWLLSRTSH